jgi:predicted AAA+ superfamily ATPase
MLDKLEINSGMIIENIVAQMLRAAGHKLFFFSNSSQTDKDSRMEIDFLLAKSKITQKHNITPIEVKSSVRYTLTSLNKCIKKYGNYLATPYVIHPTDLKTDAGITFLPLYMCPLL